MTTVTAYTLSKLLTQQAVIERNIGGEDAYGGEDPPDWQPHLTVPCRLAWARSTGARSANREYVTTSRQVPVSEGLVVLPSGTDVTEEDRISRILNADGSVLIEGVFQITAVLNDFTHMELEVLRTSLGA